MDTLLKKLVARGLVIAYEEEWVGEPGTPERHPVPTAEIRTIQVPLTHAEWCSLCMRDGDSYIGPCCGTSGYTQDILNTIFRDSGWVDSRTAWNLIQVGGSHEGHEALTEKNEKTLLAQERRWNKLRPHQKIMLCVGAARDKMKMSWLEVPHQTMDAQKPEAVIAALHEGSGYLHYKDLYSNANELPDAKSGQKHGNVALTLARVVPAARAFLEIATQVEKLPFEGFAILNDKREPVQNHYGLCLYHTRESAEDLVKAWRDANESRNEQSKVDVLDGLTVKPVRVTLDKGLEVL